MIKHVVVTGASGFLGRALCGALAVAGRTARVASRGLDGPAEGGTPGNVPSSASSLNSCVAVATIGPDTHWSSAVDGVDAVVHQAAQIRVPSNASADMLAELRSVNVVGAEGLVRIAATAGVKPFAFVGSIKVSDGIDLYTTELVRKRAHAMNRPARLLLIPAFSMRFAAAIAGSPDAARRQFGSLAVSSGKNSQGIGLGATLRQGPEETAAWFRATRASARRVLQTCRADSRHEPGTVE